MNIIRCSEVKGKYISEIIGQNRYGYSKSDFRDSYCHNFIDITYYRKN